MPDGPEVLRPTTSPLAEAKPESLNELFSRDPLTLTEEDAERICAVFRKERENWKPGEVARKTATKGASKGTRKIAAPADIDLKDLGL